MIIWFHLPNLVTKKVLMSFIFFKITCPINHESRGNTVGPFFMNIVGKYLIDPADPYSLFFHLPQSSGKLNRAMLTKRQGKSIMYRWLCDQSMHFLALWSLAKSSIWPGTYTDFPHHNILACTHAIVPEMLLLIWTTLPGWFDRTKRAVLVTVWLCVSMQFHLCNRNICNTCARALITGGTKIPSLHPDLGIQRQQQPND